MALFQYAVYRDCGVAAVCLCQSPVLPAYAILLSSIVPPWILALLPQAIWQLGGMTVTARVVGDVKGGARHTKSHFIITLKAPPQHTMLRVRLRVQFSRTVQVTALRMTS
ncbi:uncharacterized protein SETTUDRAFT_30726 [Exserohilum turcica Et28A]|uniref:Uncharacterized protein n=1 Tax=Exserohilum turcicum (strain 28A) TaxID=671987 RepID=R0J6E1_EXST2|nr:uncharacterized protein SETTUDRAFT_30726 [Exserohilum turcica Et28A]EOA92261.1 hypothetical protein SETTUDRAFT_30726 [Exserohilum turcica Et28A]